MSFGLFDLLIYLAIAAICGAVGRALAGGRSGGLLTSIALGFIGALLGGWMASELGLPEPFVVAVAGHPFPVVWSVIGATVFVAVIQLLSRSRV